MRSRLFESITAADATVTAGTAEAKPSRKSQHNASAAAASAKGKAKAVAASAAKGAALHRARRSKYPTLLLLRQQPRSTRAPAVILFPVTVSSPWPLSGSQSNLLWQNPVPAAASNVELPVPAHV